MRDLGFLLMISNRIGSRRGSEDDETDIELIEEVIALAVEPVLIVGIWSSLIGNGARLSVTMAYRRRSSLRPSFKCNTPSK